MKDHAATQMTASVEYEEIYIYRAWIMMPNYYQIIKTVF